MQSNRCLYAAKPVGAAQGDGCLFPPEEEAEFPLGPGEGCLVMDDRGGVADLVSRETSPLAPTLMPAPAPAPWSFFPGGDLILGFEELRTKKLYKATSHF